MLGLRRAAVEETSAARARPEIRDALWYRLGVIEDNSQIRTRLVALLEGVANPRAFTSVPVMLSRAGDSAMAMVVGPSYATPQGMAEIAKALNARPNTVAVLAYPGPPPVQLQNAAAFAGVSEIVDLTVNSTHLLESVEAAVSTLPAHMTTRPEGPTAHSGGGGNSPGGGGRKRTGGGGGGNNFEDEDGLPWFVPRDEQPVSPTARKQRAAIEGPTDRGRIVSVFSTKGGTGKSVVASNLAAELARTSFWPVVLVDADLQLGDIAVMLRMHPRHTMADAITRIDRLDTTMLQQMLTRHEDGRLLILPSPFEPEFGDDVKASDVGRILDLLTQFCGHVIVDTSSHLNDVNLSIFEKSDDIVVVTNMDVTSIKDVRSGVQILRKLGIRPERLRLVLNRADAKSKMDQRQVEKLVGMEADVTIPSTVMIPKSLNNRMPVLLDAPKSPAAKSFVELAQFFKKKK